MADLNERMRALPSVDEVIGALGASVVHAVAAGAARAAIDEGRARIRAGGTVTTDEVVGAARAMLEEHERALLAPVINATGVLVHTNLGRVPLGKVQLDAVAEVAGAYSNLEFDLSAGRRGSRHSHARSLLTALTGAEGALAVNNNAAAVLITLAALCGGREVIISRGELIEIGGEFRIPDVMEASGAVLVEVGTTNRTHVRDYEAALTENTAAILKVHPSNYRVVGFTATVGERELAALAQGRGVPFIWDLGSGLIEPPVDEPWLRGEPRVTDALDAGADVVTFSGDKLLGGPQAGLIVGRSELVDRIARHPLMRAMRPDKMTLAALEATLALYLGGRAGELPLWKMALAEGLEERSRALVERIAATVADAKVEAVAVPALTGGGSLPGAEVASWAVSVTHPERSSAEIERGLRRHRPPVIARIEDDRVLLDLRTVSPADDETLATAVAAILA